MTRAVLEGRPGSPGVGIGRLLWVAPTAPADAASPAAGTGSPTAGAGATPSTNGIGAADESARLDAALAEAATELERLARDTSARAGDEVGAIFEAQALFARDPGIVEPARALIRDGASAAAAIERVAAEQADVLASVDDPFFRERAADLRDVARRVVDRLAGRARPALHHHDGTLALLASDDLEPSLVAAIRPELVAGIALAGGSPSGHAAIVARALGIPLALGFGSAVDASCDGHDAALDGGEGRLVVDPAAADIEALLRSAPTAGTPGDSDASAAISSTRPTGARTVLSSAPTVAVEANVGSVREAERAAAAGADGIGLVRTELLFLGRAVAPGLAEQRSTYRRIGEAMGGRPVVFRTLDIGGDKPAAYASDVDGPDGGGPVAGPEANPALGVRGLRLGLARPALLETQLRALLEARPEHPLHILLPMVSTLDEVRRARVALQRAGEAARAAGAAIAGDVRVGIMIEVPAAAVLADALASEVDFFSIGTNDLVQYTMAVDRTNAALGDLASPLQPAVLRLIAGVVRSARAAGRPVAVCGEAAADPLAGPLLVGLGVTELSVAPQSIAPVRDRLARLDAADCRAAADAVLAAATIDEVRAIAARLAGGEGAPARVG